MPLTEEEPKCFAKIGDKRILDWILEALRAADIDNICFVGGYQIDMIRSEYPNLKFYHNIAWESNNILASLFCAEAEMHESFICSYADIVYRPTVIQKLLSSEADITLVVDTKWRERYKKRTQHPESDAEKVLVQDNRIIEIGRRIDSDRAYGEYIGVAMFSSAGAKALRDHYHRATIKYDGKPFRSASSFQKAYLIDLFQEMLEAGVSIQKVGTTGNYMEIDTEQDYEIAKMEWGS